MTPYDVGIIGLGGMGQMMLADMIEHDRFAVPVAWDPDDGACKSAQAQFSDLRIAPDAAEVIRGNAIDLLYIASPPNTHREYFLTAIAAGLKVLCEKPFGVDVAASEDLLKQIDGAGLTNVINFNHGNALGSTHIETQLQNGAIGEVSGIDIFIHLTSWPREFQKTAAWLARREQGGFTREMLSHWLYLTRRLFGEGAVSHTRVTYPDDGVSAETSLTAELEFGGVPVFIKAATGGAGPVGTEYTIWGSRTSYRLHSGGRISSTGGGDWTEELADAGDIGRLDRQRNLDGVAARLGGEPITMPDAADGFAVQRLIETLLENSKA